MRRDGGRASQHLHSTDEAGELVPQDPVEGRKNRKGVPDVGPGPGNTSEASYLESRITVTTQDSSPGLQR